MQETLHIEMDGQKVKYMTTPPKSLSGNFLQNADIWGVTDPRADILVQRSFIGKYSFWRYLFFVKRPTTLYFHQPVERMFLFLNMGADIQMQFHEQPPVLFKKDENNMYYLSEFKLKAFPKPNNKKFDLILIEMGNGDPQQMQEVLLRAMGNA